MIRDKGFLVVGIIGAAMALCDLFFLGYVVRRIILYFSGARFFPASFPAAALTFIILNAVAILAVIAFLLVRRFRALGK